MKISRHWTVRPFAQFPTTGSRWFRGNFGLGLLVDSHPQFVCITLACVVVEFGLIFKRCASLQS